jgi:cyanophycinase-like exopeptidase
MYASRMPSSRTFLLLGSGEFEPWSSEVERVALQGASGDGSVLVLPTASAPEGERVFDRWAQMSLGHYAGMGVSARIVPLKARADAERADLAEALGGASMAFFSGGNPRHLAATLKDTSFFSALIRAMERGLVFAGCSAGAIVAGRSPDAKPRLGTAWLAGLGLIANASFGVHWDRMRYFPGARPFLMSRLDRTGSFVGIDERTAILGDGERWTVHGARTAMVRHAGVTHSYRARESFALSAAG